MKRPVYRTTRVILCLMVLLVACTPASAVVLDRVVAVVNSDVITWLELYDAMERELAPKLRGLEGDARRLVLSSEEASFLEAMVIRKLQMQEAARSGVSVTDAEVDSTIENIRKKYAMSPEAFRRAVEESGTDWDHYRESMKEQLTISKLVDKEVRSRVQVPAATAEGAGEETKYHLKQIFIDGGRSEEDLRLAVEGVYRALDSGEEFEALAARVSEGPNAASGGDLGVMEVSALSEDMRRSVSGLRVGEVGPPVRSSMGVHILKLAGRVSGSGQSPEEQFQQKYDEWLKGLRDKAQVDIRL